MVKKAVKIVDKEFIQKDKGNVQDLRKEYVAEGKQLRKIGVKKEKMKRYILTLLFSFYFVTFFSQEICDLKYLNNQKIEFNLFFNNAVFSSVDTLETGFQIDVIGGAEALDILRKGSEVIPSLIKLLNDKERDWAANLLLYDILNRNALLLVAIDTEEDWRSFQKDNDLNYWNNYLKNISSAKFE